MSYLTQILLGMHRHLDAKHQPFSSEEVKGLINNGMLVHMLEFSTAEGHFKNMCDALSGKYMGPYSQYRTSASEKFNYDKENNRLVALPTSTTKAGHRISLFTEYSTIGIIIDPAKVEFLAIAPDYVYNTMSSDGLTILNANNYKDDKYINANLGTTGKPVLREGVPPSTMIVPLKRTEAEQAELKDTYDHLWKNMHKYSYIDTNEILANVPVDAVKALLFCPKEISRKQNLSYNNYDYISPNMIRKVETSCLMPAILLAKSIEQNTGRSLPVIERSYNKYNEIKIEPEKVRNALTRVPEFRELFEEVLELRQLKLSCEAGQIFQKTRNELHRKALD